MEFGIPNDHEVPPQKTCFMGVATDADIAWLNKHRYDTVDSVLTKLHARVERGEKLSSLLEYIRYTAQRAVWRGEARGEEFFS
jgi:hypothetical protein